MVAEHFVVLDNLHVADVRGVQDLARDLRTRRARHRRDPAEAAIPPHMPLRQQRDGHRENKIVSIIKPVVRFGIVVRLA